MNELSYSERRIELLSEFGPVIFEFVSLKIFRVQAGEGFKHPKNRGYGKTMFRDEFHLIDGEWKLRRYEHNDEPRNHITFWIGSHATGDWLAQHETTACLIGMAKRFADENPEWFLGLEKRELEIKLSGLDQMIAYLNQQKSTFLDLRHKLGTSLQDVDWQLLVMKKKEELVGTNESQEESRSGGSNSGVDDLNPQLASGSFGSTD